MSEMTCKHCGKTEDAHLTWARFCMDMCFSPVEPVPAPVPEPPPFKVGDWVVRTPSTQHSGWFVDGPGTTGAVRIVNQSRDGHWLEFGGNLIKWNAENFRLATEAEIKAVTHFRLRKGMLIRRKSDGAVCRVWESCNDLALDRLDAHDAVVTFHVKELAYAVWTILDSYTVQGVPASPDASRGKE